MAGVDLMHLLEMRLPNLYFQALFRNIRERLVPADQYDLRCNSMRCNHHVKVTQVDALRF